MNDPGKFLITVSGRAKTVRDVVYHLLGHVVLLVNITPLNDVGRSGGFGQDRSYGCTVAVETAEGFDVIPG